MEGKTCCVTGHRDMPSEEISSIKKALRQEIKKAVKDGFTVFLSGFADGVDQYFAEIVLEMQKENGDLKLIAVLPYRGRVKGLNRREQTSALLNACTEMVVCLLYTSDAADD